MTKYNTHDNLIYTFASGKGLPYIRYDSASLKKILQYKRNNLSAIIVVIDAITEVVREKNKEESVEIINSFVEELDGFIVNGLCAIGFWGISVEDGFPIRVDSCGNNISKKYDSVYAKMTREEYEALDRKQSMILDQRENRKFLRYITWYKEKIGEQLVPLLPMQSDIEWTPLMEECAEYDNIYRSIIRKMRRMMLYNANNERPWYNANEAEALIQQLREVVEPLREILDQDDDVNPIAKYSTSEFSISHNPFGIQFVN